MKRLAIVFAVLFVFSVSAYAQMGEGMKPEQKGPMGQGMMGGEGKMPMMPMCQEMMKQQMGEGQQMPMMQMMPMCQQMMKEHKAMVQMMMNMMQMQKKMMKGVKPAEKKEMMMEMDKMHEKMDKMMSKRMEMMGGIPKVKCAEEWLKKAIDIHEVHIKDPKTATEASQMEMMDQMKKAYECITGAGSEMRGTPPKNPEEGKKKDEHGH
ncbi:MAG: hypothetical protein A2X54_10030 [Nitrospirae bacterium GWF2_44_13]|nr:MAG: hypothetical protein A2X54_10030 [Nitrospirae bacterium GWF2_44_13]OGW33021.1 MAG: hypothetical protein A2088_02550 [Nitrospirae bacterium GWD2_44_7]OGW63412.1 MAG: hypothetical protein A2222_06190 [Nitrospirae bacterium RIFOXYA2_FULL_44_9]OGW73899.1 MAG: hypothetical protein A2484_05005 [Nitrospirae bacterium RIFOXYC2_FULL_44_7]HBG91926.1 hypothetical protein [Nitrospiraceae bacterium]